MPIWLLGALGSVRKAVAALFGFIIVRYPWQTACIALLAACVWLWGGWNGALDDLAKCQDARALDKQHYEQAQKDALAKAVAAKAAAEQHYRDLAERADHEADQAIAQARTDAERYIATHRVRVSPASPSGGTVAPAEGGGPGLPQGVPADPVVLAEPDVQACAGATAYAVKAHEWAMSLLK